VTDLLADAVAELYEADPDDFTPRRRELAAQAREAGEPAVARQIAGLRKPTRSAWVVNRLVRADPEVTPRLMALTAELRDGEQTMDGARIRELTAARGRLVDELTRQALQVSDLPAPPAALREEVTATLDAAIADPEVAANLGTLVRAAHWAGFGLAPLPEGAASPASASPASASPSSASPASGPAFSSSATSAPVTTRTPKTKKAATPAPPPAEAAAERERRRREKIHVAERAVAEADGAADTANVAERELQDTVRRLESELADARQRLAEARRQAYRAESRQRRADAELGRLRE
jgi:hypothetical protein